MIKKIKRRIRKLEKDLKVYGCYEATKIRIDELKRLLPKK